MPPSAPDSWKSRHFTKGHVIAILFFILLLPLVAIITHSAWLNGHPTSNKIVGVGKVNVTADSAQLSIGITIPSGGNVDTATAIKEAASAITQYLHDNGVEDSRITSPYSSDIEVAGFSPDNDFAALNTVKGKIQAQFPATATAHYKYSVTADARSKAIDLATKDARTQADNIAKSQNRSVIFFSDGICSTQVIDASQVFNPTSCDDKAYGTDTSPNKQVVVMMDAGAAFSF